MTTPRPVPWWIGWYSEPDLSEFELHSPWWVSGSTADGIPTMVACVLATTEASARAVILAAYDDPPDDLEWRFVDPQADDFSPFSDRFPRAPWMAWAPPVTCGCPTCRQKGTQP